MGRVVGVDRSAKMAALARERLAGRARIIQGDIGNLRGVLPDEAFDVILCPLVLHYLAGLTATFDEWARLLRPGGVAVRQARDGGVKAAIRSIHARIT
jgi:ubiquinone/menaquinone biosynthesis C-methylase UbiE